MSAASPIKYYWNCTKVAVAIVQLGLTQALVANGYSGTNSAWLGMVGRVIESKWRHPGWTVERS